MTPNICCLFFLAAVSSWAEPAVHYELWFPNAVHHEAEIEATFSQIGTQPLEIVMSRSSPGRYALHEFAKNVSGFRAVDASGQALPMQHDTTSSWRVTPRDGTVRCHYTLYGDELDGTYAAIDLTHAHLNLPATLVWARGLENAPATLHFNMPAGLGWKAATQLIPLGGDSFSTLNLAGENQAGVNHSEIERTGVNPAGSNLEWLMDSPVELNASPIYDWMLDGQQFRLALHQQGSDADVSTFLAMCKTVVAEERGIFGAFPKYDHGSYTFLVDYLPYADGDGMEHRDSTVISGAVDLREAAHRAIGTVSHEFFHSWNVKRIRPRSLEPFNFERTNMSGELWFAEGFTNYYGLLVLERANIDSLDEFLNGMGKAVNAVINDPGQRVRSAFGMSEQAPFVDAARAVDPTDVANDFISYYTYGQALAFGVDLSIRARYPGKSLDDWMRTMWREHPDVDRPYTLEDLEKTLAETTGDAAFAHELFSHHIVGLQPLDYARLASAAGLELTLAHPGQVWLGYTRTNGTDSGLEIVRPTLRQSPLYQAGVDSGDVIQACGTQTVKTVVNLESCLVGRKAGESVSLRIKGRAGVRTVSVTLAPDPSLQLQSFERLGKPVPPAAFELRLNWLASKATLARP